MSEAMSNKFDELGFFDGSDITEYVEALHVVAEKATTLVGAIFPMEEYDTEWIDLVNALDKLRAAEEGLEEYE